MVLRRTRHHGLTLALATSVAVSSPFGTRAAHACATAPMRGEAVRVVDEEALIVWDEATQIEHFVRRATFRSSARAFGFLVPTPTKPELAEIDNRIFDELAQFLVPKVIYDDGGFSVEPTLSWFFFMRSAQKSAAVEVSAAPVRVLDARNVAGYDAVVLEADRADALSKWLADHGFTEGDHLTAWLEPYVEKRWKITAFKVDDDDDRSRGQARAFGTQAVRMSFRTDRPFFPYREPSDQRETMPASLSTLGEIHRSLRLYVIGTERAEGTVGESTAFAGKTVFAGALTEHPIASIDAIAGGLKGRGYLTIMLDESGSRPGEEDLFFAPARDRSDVMIPPVRISNPTRIPIPLDVIFLAGSVIGVVVWRRRRRA